MNLRMGAPSKREKLALLVLLAVVAAIGVTEVWFPADVPAADTPMAATTDTAPSASPAQASSTMAVPATAPEESAASASVAAAEITLAPETPVALAVTNVFPAQTWQPPPPPPPPPPQPTAPPLPFQYGGQLVQGEERFVFLLQQKRQHIVRVGDAIDNLYRVEAIVPGRIEFTYLPLKQKQELLTGSPS